MQRKTFLYIFLLLSVILGDIFLFKESLDIRIFGIVLLYIIFIKFLKLKSNTTITLSLFFLLFAYLEFIFSNRSYYLNPETAAPVAERSAAWAFLFFVIGVIQKWKE